MDLIGSRKGTNPRLVRIGIEDQTHHLLLEICRTQKIGADKLLRQLLTPLAQRIIHKNNEKGDEEWLQRAIQTVAQSW